MNGVLHTYTLDGTKILKETWGENTLVPLYDNEDSVCGIVYNGSPYYFVKNLQGDVITVLDKNKQTAARYVYDAWGVPEIKLDSSTCQIATVNPFRYRCYYYDTEIAKYYLQSRYYDAQTGRFVNGDEVAITSCFDETCANLYGYCGNSPTNDSDAFGYASNYTKNKKINQMLDVILDSMPNVYSPDFYSREYVKFRIGTTNLNVTIGFGACVQSNKNALFGGLFKKGTLEVSAYFGITNRTCFAFSAGVTWQRAYLKLGLGIAIPSQKRAGIYAGMFVEISVPTWLLAVATVAVAVASVYNPAVAAYVAKFIAAIRKSIKVVATTLVPIIPSLVGALGK